MTLLYENLNCPWLSKPHRLCHSPVKPATVQPQERKLAETCHLPVTYGTGSMKKESHRIRNTVDISAIFEIWSFQTKPGNFLLSAVKEVTLLVPMCKTWLSSHTHREEMQREKRLTLHSASVYWALSVSGALGTERWAETQGPRLLELRVRATQTGKISIANRGSKCLEKHHQWLWELLASNLPSLESQKPGHTDSH